MFVWAYPNPNDSVKRFNTTKYYISKDIQSYNVIINGKNYYDQPTDSETIQYKEIRKLTAE